MLFLSPHPQYQLVGIRQAVPVYHPTNGVLLDTVPGIDAEFFHGGVAEWAIVQALDHQPFQDLWSGLPPEQDKRAMISSFDTDEYARDRNLTDEDKAFLEDRLLKHPDYGQRYILAQSPEQLASIPWPSYDTTHHFQVAKIALEIGVPLDYVLTYELNHKNRPAVVKGLKEAMVEHQPESADDLVPA